MHMDIRRVVAVALMAISPAVAGQGIKTASGPQPTPRYVQKAKQPYNPGATPLKCDQHADPRYRLLCNDIEHAHVQGMAKRQGLPMPSADVISLPSMGSAGAKALGAACIGGTAMRRLPNGWSSCGTLRGIGGGAASSDWGVGAKPLRPTQIGRASCRERVF